MTGETIDKFKRFQIKISFYTDIRRNKYLKMIKLKFLIMYSYAIKEKKLKFKMTYIVALSSGVEKQGCPTKAENVHYSTAFNSNSYTS